MIKKICFFDYDMSNYGGIESVTANLCNSLVNIYEVHLISICQQGKIKYKLDKRVKYSYMTQSNCRLRKMQKLIFFKAKKYLKENKIDVAMLQGTYPGFILSPARFFSKTKFIFCDHGALMNQWKDKSAVFIRFLSSLLCHKTVTLTEQSKSDYIKKIHLPKKKVQCIMNWIDLDIERSQDYNINSKKIISAGRFGKEKGFDMLIKAFAPVAKKHPDWSLDIYGDGEMFETVLNLVHEYSLEDNVNLKGVSFELNNLYKDYSMYVLPSYREGLPLVLLEAKANMLPIVSFDIMTGPREIVRDGIDGILIKPYEIEKMSSAIFKLIENPELRNKMSYNSQQNLYLFSKENIIQKWIKLINS